jgi:acetylglutamate kinase
VLKIGGAALTDASWLDSFARQAAMMDEPCIIVHGGGPEITTVSEQLGVTAEWNNGKRVTPPAALDAAAMVLTGRVNKRIVAALIGAGVDAAGFCGVDGGLIRAEVAHDGALGRVGRVTAVRAEMLQWMLERGMTPVISPISLAADGGMLNVNADEVASAVASAVGATELVFLTDVAGVMVSDVTREPERIALYTTQLTDGSLFFVVGVAPAREFNAYRQIFNRSVQSLQLNDRYRNSRF